MRPHQICMLPAEKDQNSTLLLKMNAFDTPVMTAVSGLSAFPESSFAAEAAGVHKRALGYFCCWDCARRWNMKYSPPFLRSRRDLAIDLLAVKGDRDPIAI